MRREIEVASTLAVALAVLSSAGCTFDAEGLRSAPDAAPEGAGGCPEGKMLCSGSCVETASDSANCGTCRLACPATKGCAESACKRFVPTSNTVKDYESGLVWQRGVSPQKYNWEAAGFYCSTLSLVGPGGVSSGWRLPAVDELVGIVDYSRQNPSIDTEAFPGTPSDRFWTSTPFAGSSGSPWAVIFGTGVSVYGDTTDEDRVRCVFR
jgi:hypothetical protein